MAWQLTQVQTAYDVKKITAATLTSHECWIMHVKFDCSHMTVRNVQAHCCQQELVTGLYWMVAVLSSVMLAVESLSLTDVNMPD